MEERPKLTLLEDIQDLDRKLVKLIARRAELLQKLSASRHKSARAASRFAGEEKDLRKNWEQAASRLSRDERFLRDAFSLLQEVTLIPEHLEERRGNLYNLAPPQRPVAFDLPAISSHRQSSLWISMAAGRGSKLELLGQALSDSLVELIKALNQAGAHLSWDREAAVSSRGGEPLLLADKTIYAGDSVFNFYLLSALSLGKPGVVKFTGDSALKLHDFTIWRNTMPLFGARLAHVIPKSRGLPVHLECSGLLPQEVKLPADLLLDATLALFLAAASWQSPIRFLDNGSEQFRTAVSEAVQLFETSGVEFAHADGGFSILRAPRETTLEPQVYLDLEFAYLLLGFAIMTGGEARLRGRWPEFLAYSDPVEAMFAWAGAAYTRQGENLKVTGNKAKPVDSPLYLDGLPKWTLPFCLVFGARLALKEKAKPQFGFKNAPPAHFELSTALEFLQVLGADLEEAENANANSQGGLWRIVPASADEAEVKLWTAPDSSWGMAMALGAYLKPNLALTNPALVSKVFPAFWPFYNSLPSPQLMFRDRRKQEDEKPRRKVIAKGVASDLSELRADYEPQSQDNG